MENIQGFNIVLVCGKGDLLVSPDDYNWLKDELINNGNNVEFLEYQQGHLGLVMPKDKEETETILAIIKSDYDTVEGDNQLDQIMEMQSKEGYE